MLWFIPIKNTRLRRPDAREGFTLLELLVVVVILVVLAAIAIPVLLGQKNKALDARARTTVANAAQLLNDTRGSAGIASYNPDTRTITTIFGGGGGMGVAGDGEMHLPTAAIWTASFPGHVSNPPRHRQ